MDSRELTPDQLAKLKDALGRHQAYLNALVKRMDAERFPSSDQLYLDAIKAKNAVEALRMTIHYLTCQGQTGGSCQ